RLFNAALLFANGEMKGRILKVLLPTYDVYDEYRYFESGPPGACVEWRGLRLGVHLCEDMWNMEEEAPYRLYSRNPIEEMVEDGADILINLSATPFAAGKHEHRGRVIGGICRKFGLPLVMVNQVGANGELIFDGRSRVHSADGSLILSAPAFEEALIVWDSRSELEPLALGSDETRDLYDALVLGIRDYFRKTESFSRVLVGISGGIDSAVTCALAVAALGAEKVVAVALPAPHSSYSSLTDARQLATNLGIEFHAMPIHDVLAAFGALLKPQFGVTEEGVAEENLQARVRGVSLMALSNKFDYLLLSTGNKSEAAMGYATLYGDMSGGLSVLSDVLKTQVYELARFINKRGEIIPASSVEKAPSAELRPDQKDLDSLPPYEVLDVILKLYIEEGADAGLIAGRTGFDEELIRDVLNRVDRNEFKRRQAPPGLRVTRKAFGSGRRLPLVMRWNHEATGASP
ncbi:MAG: NAD+ synthase, partial [Rhodothermales bacterium]